ncbi:hypothetical protein ACL6C3_30705 [Capilliphycus salinus ALCB114379]
MRTIHRDRIRPLGDLDFLNVLKVQSYSVQEFLVFTEKTNQDRV